MDKLKQKLLSMIDAGDITSLTANLTSIEQERLKGVIMGYESVLDFIKEIEKGENNG